MKMPTSILTALAAIISLGGCAKNHSLVDANMPSETIDWKIRNALQDVTSLEERIKVVGSMTDWAQPLYCDYYWGGFAVVPWDSETQEMKIPLLNHRMASIYLVWFADDELVIQFDSEGRVSNVLRQENDQGSVFHSQTDSYKKLDLESKLDSVVFPSSSISWNGESTTLHVTNRSPEINLPVQFGIVIVEDSDEKKQLIPQIETNPKVDFSIIEQRGPVSYRPHRAGAYLICDSELGWNWVQSAKKRTHFGIDRASPQFVPEFVTEYRFLITLAPHDGVDIVINLVPPENDS